MVTAVITVVALLGLMFSTDPDEPVRETALFGSLFFEVTEVSGDTTKANLGVDSVVPLVVLFLVIGLILTMFQLVYRVLKARRAFLLAQQNE